MSAAILAGASGLLGAAGSYQAQRKLGEAGDVMFGVGDKAYEGGTYKPYGVTSGAGTTSFDGENSTFALDPRYQERQDQMLGLGSQAFDAAGGDYNQLANQLYTQQRDLGAGSRNAEALALGGSMFGSGRAGLSMSAEGLGAQGGGMLSPDGFGFAQAFAQQDAQDRYNAQGQAQDQRQRDIDIGNSMMNQSMLLDRAGLEQQQLGGMLGQYRSGANNAAGSNLIGAYGAGADFMAARGRSQAGGLQGLGGSVGSWGSGGGGQPSYNTDPNVSGNNPFSY